MTAASNSRYHRTLKFAKPTNLFTVFMRGIDLEDLALVPISLFLTSISNADTLSRTQFETLPDTPSCDDLFPGFLPLRGDLLLYALPFEIDFGCCSSCDSAGFAMRTEDGLLSGGLHIRRGMYVGRSRKVK
jgi:hypothetical protein